MQPLPNILHDFVNGLRKLRSPWIEYLQQFTIAPPAFMDVTPDGSPFEYEAKEPGYLFITGGTVSAITLTRGSETITVFPDTTTPRLVPVAVADIVTITYTVIPTLKFIPSYGVDTYNF